jgi:hypothetical protein
MPHKKKQAEWVKFILDINKIRDFYEKRTKPRKKAPPKIRKWVKMNGDKMIQKISVCRKPVQKAIQKILDIITLGKFSKSLKGLHYDDIFHLYIYITIDGTSWRIEKNEVVTLKKDNRVMKENCLDISLMKSSKSGIQFSSNAENQELKKRKIRLNKFMKKGENYQSNFWGYNAKGNNCQTFCESLLVSNKLIKIGDKQHKFIKQDSEAIFEKNPKYLDKFGKTLTDIAAVFDIFKEGY